MKFLKIMIILLVVYAGVVATFESLLGYLQPENQRTLSITTQNERGERSDRVLTRLESEGQLYVAANHWPRAWYKEALANPNVQIEIDGKRGAYLAVPVTGDEHDQVNRDNAVGFGFRVLTGFPPRYFVRLEVRGEG